MPAARQERADRILDVAKDLLLRWGYRRIAIEEVAKRAEVGKGTIYLHWRSRDQLFGAVAAREGAAMTGAVVAAMRADPAEIALHRYMRTFFVAAMERPVLRAIFTRDSETLDKLLNAPWRKPLETAKATATRNYLTALSDNGLLRAGMPLGDVEYQLHAVAFGFFAAEPLLGDDMKLALSDKADQLANVLYRTFAPLGELTTAQFAAVAPQVIDTFDWLAGEYRATAYGEDHE